MYESLWVMAAGFILGVLFYGGLWWTVSQMADFRRPALILVLSVLLRTGTALGGFHLVAGGAWSRILLCLLGFLAARLAVTRSTRLSSPAASAEARHAP